MSWFRKRALVALTSILLAAVGVAVYGLIESGNLEHVASFPGFPLAKPVLAQGGSSVVTILETEAGLSAYVQLPEADRAKVDLDKLINELFIEVRQRGDNYVIGKMRVVRTTFEAIPPVETLLYADTDGWLVASLPRGKDGADMLTFYKMIPSCGAVGFLGERIPASLDFGSGLTAIECGLGVATSVLGAALPQDIKWYHWEFPDPNTHLAVGAVNVGFGSRKNLSFAVPAGAIWRDASVKTTFNDLHAAVVLDGSSVLVPLGPTCTRESFLNPLEAPLPAAGEVHNINVDASAAACSFSGSVHVGVVLVYKFP